MSERGPEDRDPWAPESVAAHSGEPAELTPGEVLERGHRAFVARIREIEGKEPAE